MSNLHEVSSTPKKTENKIARNLVVGFFLLAPFAMLFGPNIGQSIEDGRAIDRKQGPAKAYVTKALGELVLDGQQLESTVGNHECDAEAFYGIGDRSRHCKVAGESLYDIDVKKFSDAYDVASQLMLKHHIARGESTVTVQGQELEVKADFSIRLGVEYNNSIDRGDTERKVPDKDYVVVFDVAAYTVDHTAPDYPYNDDNP